MDLVDYNRAEIRRALPSRGRVLSWTALLVAGLVALPFVAGNHAAADPSPAVIDAAATCPGATYTVVAGDSWSKIASKVGVTMSALLAANNATTSTVIHPGNILCVPSGASPTTPTTTVGSATTTTTPRPPGAVAIRQFPIQGTCYFTDTFGAPRSGGRSHEGVDIIAKSGQLLYAVDDGTLTKQYIDAPGALAGNGWRLTRSDGTYFFYAHMSAFATGLKVGSTVKAGQILGNVGMTGNAGTPHLHFEVHPGGGAAVNPTPVVKSVDGCKITAVPTQPGAPTSTTVTPTTTAATPAPTTAPATVPATTAPAAPTTTAAPAPTTTSPVAPGGVANKWQFIAAVSALDTGGSKLAIGTARTVKVEGLAGVPAGVTGVMVRLAVRNVTNGGYLTVHACDTGAGGASTLTILPGRLNATTTIVKVVGGNICVTSSTAVDVRLDVVGFVSAQGVGLQPIVTKRAFDTRTSAPIAAGGTKSASPSALGSPLGAKAVTVTVTLLSPPVAGSIGIGPCGGTPWILPFTTAPMQVFSLVARTNDAGVCVSASAQVHVVLDVTGVWTGTTQALTPRGPKRLFDSRSSGVITPTGKIVGISVPAGSVRAQLTITVLGNATGGALFAWNCADARPTASVVATTAGSNNSVTVTMNVTSGALCLASNNNIHVLVDLTAAG